MGLAITKTDFSPEDYTLFKQRIAENLSALEQVISRPDFGGDVRSLGAEVELYIIDQHNKPFPINTDLEKAAANKQVTLELNQYNIEFNFTPITCNDAPFSALEQQWTEAYSTLSQCAQKFDAQLTSVGILPTLTQQDLGKTAITPMARYQALSEQLRRHRNNRPFEIRLNGADPLHFRCKDVSPEGANASFQFHYRSPGHTWVNHYNAAQLVTPLIVAVAGNSPFFLGHRLWHETRIGLFKQSVDSRLVEQQLRHEPARVSLGHGWVRQSIFELFAESVALFPPLLPICGNERAGEALKAGRTPLLQELRLHHGCIWPWNRAIYDPADGGHIRMELRALPSGPTAIDMLANAALAIGLIEGLQPYLASLLCSLPFHLVAANFYRAAQSGLETVLLWPDPNAKKQLAAPKPIAAKTLLKHLLPIADQGLASIGIAAQERKKYLETIEARTDTEQTGATWQLKQYEQLQKSHDSQTALAAMVAAYQRYSCQNIPVHLWPIE